MSSKYVISVGKSCVACGACQKVCPRQAIAVFKGIKAVVNEDRCVGCGLCLKECPAGVISKHERIR